MPGSSLTRQPRIAKSEAGLGAYRPSSAVILMLSVTGPAFAQANDAFVSRMRDLRETRQIEQDLAKTLKAGDKAALAAFARKIDNQDGKTIRWFAVGILIGSKEARELSLRLGPCEQAGILIRSIAYAAGTGRLAMEERGAAFLTKPRSTGNTYAEIVGSCELLAGLPVSTRGIGSACVTSGTCNDDDED